MRRPAGNKLVPNEERLLLAASSLDSEGHTSFHGYLLAGEIRRTRPDQRVMAYSTLYRCLERLVQRDLVEVAEVDDDEASGGPPRKMFSLTEAGHEQAAELRSTERGAGLAWPSD